MTNDRIDACNNCKIMASLEAENIELRAEDKRLRKALHRARILLENTRNMMLHLDLDLHKRYKTLFGDIEKEHSDACEEPEDFYSKE